MMTVYNETKAKEMSTLPSSVFIDPESSQIKTISHPSSSRNLEAKVLLTK